MRCVALFLFVLAACQPPSDSVTGYVQVDGGRVFYEMYHADAPGIPLMLIHGGPGGSSCWFGLLDEYITDRPVIRYDQLETGRSDRPGNRQNWKLPHFVDEVDAIRAELNLEQLHVLGSSWGGAVAAEYALTGESEGLRSLILAGPLLSTPRWLEDANELVSLMPKDLQEAIRRHEAAGTTDHPDYVAATDSFYARFLFHQQPVPQVPECEGVVGNGDVYNTMWGPSEFASTGTLLEYDRTARLPELTPPTLLLGGEFDEARPETLREFAAMMPDAVVEVVAGAGHMTMVDKPAEVAAAVSAFLQSVESRPADPDLSLAVRLETEAFTSANASIGDVDGDGDPDIVLAKGRHWPLVQMMLLNDGAGQFGEATVLAETADRTYTSALIDLDGDSDLDLVVGNDRPDPKRIYRNDGSGHFESFGTFGEPDWPTRNVTVADLNGDDRPDIAVANRGGPDRSANAVCLNDGAGRFPTCTELSRESATTIAAGDLTGDGVPDLLVPHRDGGQSYIFVNDGAGGFTERRPFGPDSSATRAVALADLNADGMLDVVLGDGQRGGAQVYLRTGDATFATPIHLGRAEDDAYSIGSADLNGDGTTDLVIGHRGATLAAYLNFGSVFRSVRFGDGEGAVYGLAIGDLDSDGRPDIVAGRSEAVSTVYFNR